MTLEHELVLLPGMAADARQFEPQRAAFASMRVGEWIEPRPMESLAEYAARMAPGLGVTGDTVLGGSSFGGMVALEVARIVRPRAVVLIGSCRTRAGLRGGLGVLARIGGHLPGVMIDAGRILAVPMASIAGPAPRLVRRQLAEMSRGFSAADLKWAARAVMTWPGCADPGVPVHHIHGLADRMMPAARAGADVVVAGAGHVLNMTHAAEVNSFIGEVLAGSR